MEFNLNRIQYVILSILRKNKADSPMLSMSCNEIAEIEKYDKPSTIYKHLRILKIWDMWKEVQRLREQQVISLRQLD